MTDDDQLQRIFELVRLTRACSKLAKAAQMVEPFQPKITTKISARFARFASRQKEVANNEVFAGSLADLRDFLMVLADVIRHYDIDDTRTTDQLVDELLDLVDELEAWGKPFGLRPGRGTRRPTMAVTPYVQQIQSLGLSPGA